jgi:hypothetical protein
VKKLTVLLLVAMSCLALAGCVFGPRANTTVAPTSQTATSSSADGQTDSAAVLGALRAPIETKLGQPVKFETDRLTIADGWAFVSGQTLRPDGSTIDYSQTPYKEAVAQGAFDDGFSALLRLENGTWTVVAFSIGATDVPWVDWPKTYGAPASILPPM